MPSLGADMETGKLVEWRIHPGDTVQRGDIVALVETQKGLIDIEIWQSGVIEELRVQPGVEVPVGTVLATLHEPGAKAPAARPTLPPAPPSVRPAPPPPPESSAVAPKPRPAASPSARHLARELDVDLATVRGTGPHGAITRDDVSRAATSKSSASAVAAALPPASRAEAASAAPVAAPPAAVSGMRQAIAAAMARSKREIPHYYLALDMDVHRAVDWLEAENRARPITERVLFAALLLKATALAAREFPEMNGYYVDGAYRPQNRVHVGVGIALRQGGLIAPALHDLDRLSLGEAMSHLADLVKRARGGGLRSSELTDSTMTVTNLGDQGVHSVFGIIYPPQVALVGFGKPTPRPWAENGMLGVRPVVTATLAADHRVSDGHAGARFLAAIEQKLREPEKL